MSDRKPVILVTGGAGYVGSHSVLLLLEQNYQVVVVDNCSNSFVPPRPTVDASDEKHACNGNKGSDTPLPESLRRVELLAGKQLAEFHKLDLVSQADRLDDVFNRNRVLAVVHFAASKSLNESIELPLEYYTNNLVGTINLLNIMRRHNCKNLIFSSSATVYGLPRYTPVDEQHPVGQNVLNPYGRTKCMIEQLLTDLCAVPQRKTSAPLDEQQRQPWNIVCLRYFNPVGAHPSGFIGEHTQGVPNNLMPYIAQVAIKKRDKLFVFGDDFDTPDGTGVRDFIHIMDLASGHTHALDYILHGQRGGPSSAACHSFKAFNLGTGKGYSVLEAIKTFETVNNVTIPYEVIQRREGDAGEVYANVDLAERELNWRAKLTLAEMVRDVYRWQATHPDGYKTRAHQPNSAPMVVPGADKQQKSI